MGSGVLFCFLENNNNNLEILHRSDVTAAARQPPTCCVYTRLNMAALSLALPSPLEGCVDHCQPALLFVVQSNGLLPDVKIR